VDVKEFRIRPAIEIVKKVVETQEDFGVIDIQIP
jgi:hypothetical protein